MRTQQLKLKEFIVKELPILMQNDVAFREIVLDISRPHFADKAETDNRFEQLIARLDRFMDDERKKWADFRQEIVALRAESQRKWDKFQQEIVALKAESERKWDKFQQEIVALRAKSQETMQRLDQKMAEDRQWREENERKWEENEKKWEAKQDEDRQWREANERKWEESQKKWEAKQEQDRQWREESQKKWDDFNRKHNQLLGAVGRRWGLHSEASFRNGLAGILKDFKGVEVLNVTEWDDEGVVFGQPDQIELDIIIKNGVLMVCEMKSSVTKSDMHVFEKKVRFYEQKHDRLANKMIVISPMVDDNALPLAKKLGIDVYSYADEVEL
jgi:hypothetical protein